MSQPGRSSPGRKSGLLKHQIQLVKRRTLEGKERFEVTPIEENLSFEKGFFLFIRAVQLLTQESSTVKVKEESKLCWTPRVVLSRHEEHGDWLRKPRDIRPREKGEGSLRFEDDKIASSEGFTRLGSTPPALWDAQKNDGVVLVGLAGPSGAGKTVFSEKVATFMPGIVAISMDNYNDASRVIDGNYDDPRLTDYDTLLENIQGLREGRAVDVPIYDFKTSSRVGYSRVEVPQSRIIMVEGIYALSEKLRPLLDLRVSITGGVHFDLVKRVLRDINRSGQEPEDIIHQISETVYPMYKAFIEPDLQTAHIKIVNKFNPFSGFQNATYILKSSVTVSEDQIRSILSPKAAESMEETYDIYLLPPGEDRETCQSYLRMRNRDGRYSLMFEEWVTDGPYIISPRITFEVSVRLLGGLMALGYEMASILKRVSRVYTDEEHHFTIKIDKLEQLQRTYVQVQGKDRQVIRGVAKQLGMEGHYVPRSYIEQIQLERLTKEVMAVPEELKERLSGGLEDLGVASPRFAASWADPSLPTSLEKPVLRSQSWHHRARRREEKSGTGGEGKEGKGRLEVKVDGKGRELESPHSPSAVGDWGLGPRLGEQLQAITERLDEVMSRLEALEGRLPEKAPGGGGGTPFRPAASANGVLPNGHYGASGVVPTAGPPLPPVGSWGSQTGSAFGPGAGTASGPIGMQGAGSAAGFGGAYGGGANGGSAGDGTALADEVRLLVRGQRHLATQLDILSSIMRDSAGSSISRNGSRSERSWWDGLFGSMRTGHAGLATAAILGVTGVATVGVLVTIRSRQS